MKTYRVLRKEERWVETIIYDVESPEQALEESDYYDTDWEVAGTPEFTGEYEIYEVKESGVR